MGNVSEFVLTRSVRDAAAILDVVGGPMPGDLFIAPPASRPYRCEIGAPVERLRVGLLTHDPILDLPLNPECLSGVEKTGRLLESMGHTIEYSSPAHLAGPSGLGHRYWGVISTSAIADALDFWSECTGKKIGPDDVEPYTWAQAEEGRQQTATQIHAAVRRLEAGVCRVPEWWADGFDLLITPTMIGLPPKVDEKDPQKLAAAFGLLTMPFSLTGQPAISLPLHWSGAGLPVGIQLIADFAREDLLIRVASQIEEAQPWQDRYPFQTAGFFDPPVHTDHQAI